MGPVPGRNNLRRPSFPPTRLPRSRPTSHGPLPSGPRTVAGHRRLGPREGTDNRPRQPLRLPLLPHLQAVEHVDRLPDPAPLLYGLVPHLPDQQPDLPGCHRALVIPAHTTQASDTATGGFEAFRSPPCPRTLQSSVATQDGAQRLDREAGPQRLKGRPSAEPAVTILPFMPIISIHFCRCIDAESAV